jgi:hypothetical protein
MTNHLERHANDAALLAALAAPAPDRWHYSPAGWRRITDGSQGGRWRFLGAWQYTPTGLEIRLWEDDGRPGRFYISLRSPTGTVRSPDGCAVPVLGVTAHGEPSLLDFLAEMTRQERRRHATHPAA